MTFRKDINALRAIAVIAVVLFHFNASWLPGGFAGVDVFFVISGFLMTGIIFRGIEKENFSILKFYVSRANRIIPALAVLCFALLIFGWFYLTPQDYKSLSKHVGNSITFFSNIIYWKEAGYFDVSSHEKWLLHTWSLSVEWQFYIIYPLVLIGIKKYMPIESIKITILLSAIFFFVLCIIATYKWPNPAYYLLPSRAWQMMFGGVAYLYPLSLKEENRARLERLGILLIVCSYFFISEDSTWPGYLAIIPVSGAFFILQANHVNSIITNNIVLQKIGKYSYSIYLWHWPLVVGIYHYSLDSVYTYLGIIFSVFLGFLSYECIEKFKFKKEYNTLFSYLKCKPIYMVLMVGLLSVFIYFENGFMDRFSISKVEENIIKELVIPNRSNGYCFYSYSLPGFEVSSGRGIDCYLGKKDKHTKTLLFGDSFAGQYEPFFDEIFNLHNESIHSIVTNWCTPSITTRFNGPKDNPSYKQCLLNRKYLKDNISKYQNIIFAGSWELAIKAEQFKDVLDIIKKASQEGVQVFIMAAPFRYQKNPLSDFYRGIYFDFEFDINSINGQDTLMAKGNHDIKEMASKYQNVHFIDRSLLFPKKNTFIQDGIIIPYSLDGEHISTLGAKYSAKYFMKQKEYKEIIGKFHLR